MSLGGRSDAAAGPRRSGQSSLAGSGRDEDVAARADRRVAKDPVADREPGRVQSETFCAVFRQTLHVLASQKQDVERLECDGVIAPGVLEKPE